MPQVLLHIPPLPARAARLIALLLAVNYFAFQVELFEDEYEENHPRQHEGPGISAPTLTWESFDKDNAPQPFVVAPLLGVELIALLEPPAPDPLPPHHPFREHRDKSPPESRTAIS